MVTLWGEKGGLLTDLRASERARGLGRAGGSARQRQAPGVIQGLGAAWRSEVLSQAVIL